MLDSLITSKTRLKLLIKFFVSASNKGYLRGIAEEFHESTNSIRKELNQLCEAGYLSRSHKDNKIYYQANTDHQLFKSLQNLVREYLGLHEIVDVVISKIGEIKQVCLIGDSAKGIDSGTIELLIIGNKIDSAYLLRLRGKTERALGKKIKLYFERPTNVSPQIILYQANFS